MIRNSRLKSSAAGWIRAGVTFFAVVILLPAWAPGRQQMVPPRGDSPGERPPSVGQGELLFRSPVSGRYEAVPLERTQVAMDVRGLVVAATVTQQYLNSTGYPIEAVYTFPLPHNASVYDMEMRIGERRIHSVIREREEAKRIYTEAKAEGKRAALVEEERPNIFTASVANLMPGDRIEVQLRYVQPLAWEDGRIRLTFPMVVGPRYIPGTHPISYQGTGTVPDTDAVPDASRITPPLRNPESRPGHDITVSVDLDVYSGLISCLSHNILIQPLQNGRQRVSLASGTTIPNRDFILEFRRASPVSEPQFGLFLSPETGTGEAHFVLAAFPPTVPRGERQPIEMLYLIDVSGSMAGDSIQQARAGLLQALDRLRPTDRFNIVAFSSWFVPFSNAPQLATTEALDAARTFVRNLEANGGTEMLPALKYLMAMPKAPEHLRHIVALTDGDLGNEEEIFAALRSSLGDARLFTVAIGSAPNHFLATKMAQFGRGSFTHIANLDEIQQQMANLLNRIESPVLTDVQLTFEGVEVDGLYPARPPDLFLRQPLVVYGRIIRGRAGRLRITGRSENRTYDTEIPFDAAAASFHPGITTLWARQRIDEALDHWRTSDPSAQKELRDSIVADAIRYHLVTRFTSLVAVEEVIVNPGGNANTSAVPTELPAGWKLDAFAAPATGTADSFLEALGALLLLAGTALAFLLHRTGARA